MGLEAGKSRNWKWPQTSREDTKTPISQIQAWLLLSWFCLFKDFSLCSGSWRSKLTARRGTSRSHPKRGQPRHTCKPSGRGRWLREPTLRQQPESGGGDGEGKRWGVRRGQFPARPAGPGPPRPAALRLPPLPRHRPTCLSGAASVSSRPQPGLRRRLAPELRRPDGRNSVSPARRHAHRL